MTYPKNSFGGKLMQTFLLCTALVFSVYGLATAIVNFSTWMLKPKNNYKDILVLCICGVDAYSDLYFSFNRVKTDYGKKVSLVVVDCGIYDEAQRDYCRDFCHKKGIPIFKRTQFPENFICGI